MRKLSGLMTSPDNPLSAYIVGDFFDNTLDQDNSHLLSVIPRTELHYTNSSAEGETDFDLRYDYKEIPNLEYLAS